VAHADPRCTEFWIVADGRLTPLSPATFQTPQLLSVGLAATPDGRSVYAATAGVLQLDVDPLTGQLSPKSPSTVGAEAWTITVAPDGRSAYVVGISSGVVAQFTVDLARGVQERRLANLRRLQDQGDCVSFVATGGTNRPGGHYRRPGDTGQAMSQENVKSLKIGQTPHAAKCPCF
jgi:hypothetical protein